MRRLLLVLLLLLPLAAARGAETPHRMVAAADPRAAQAGLDVLRAGGSAVDAAVAVQMVLTVVEPQASGIGGGAFIVLYDDASKRFTTWDGREAAPAAAGPDLFLLPDGQPMPFRQAVLGGRSVGVPGAVRALEAAHRRSGKLRWARLFDPAIQLAESGFVVSPRLAGQIAADAPQLARQAAMRGYFLQSDGSAPPAGTKLANPALANTLRGHRGRRRRRPAAREGGGGDRGGGAGRSQPGNHDAGGPGRIPGH